MKRVIFFVRKFPVLSQTFVIEQINGLISRGADVKIVALYKEEENIGLESLKEHNLLKRTYFISPPNAQKVKKPLKLLFLYFFKFIVTIHRKEMIQIAGFADYALSKGKVNLAYEVAITAWINRNVSISADSIVAHFGNNGVIAQKLANIGILKGKLNTVFHGYEMSEYDSIDFWKNDYVSLSKTSHLLPISNFWKKRLISWGADSEAITVLRMGVDINRYLSKKRTMSNPINIVSVARATEKKGLEYAIKMMPYLNNEFRLSIIGGGELESKLIELSDHLGLTDRVTFFGAKPPSFVKSFLDKSDIFLLPSVTDSLGDMEGIPVALMEAMAAGLIVVSTLHSGIPELIEHGFNGFLVPEKNSKGLAEAIILASSLTPEELQLVRENARKKIKSDFNSKVLAKQLYNLL